MISYFNAIVGLEREINLLKFIPRPPPAVYNLLHFSMSSPYSSRWRRISVVQFGRNKERLFVGFKRSPSHLALMRRWMVAFSVCSVGSDGVACSTSCCFWIKFILFAWNSAMVSSLELWAWLITKRFFDETIHFFCVFFFFITLSYFKFDLFGSSRFRFGCLKR